MSDERKEIERVRKEIEHEVRNMHLSLRLLASTTRSVIRSHAVFEHGSQTEQQQGTQQHGQSAEHQGEREGPWADG
jgi:hypothetical protein